MPANRAVAYGEDVDYRVIEVTEVGEGSHAKVGEKFVLAASLLSSVTSEAGIVGHKTLAEIKGSVLAGARARHPFHGLGGYEFEVPLLPADFVTTEQGTGMVHIAPSHGADDFDLGMKHGLDVPDTVAEDGLYTDKVPLFEGTHVFKAAEPIIEALTKNDALLAAGKLVHSYPHSWRSKAPLIFRAAPQWFIPMDGDGKLREKALQAISDTSWVPSTGENRIRSMIEQRPDWCVSRQRAWGVPIAVFVERKTGAVLRDQDVIERIANAFEQEGADAWFTSDPGQFLGPDRNPADYDQVMDILDVWFDSGSTHATVLEQRDDLEWPASLYLEGSDQHRGWFHSSLLESCGTRGRAPYNAVLTHGFVVDSDGRKMSKSVGNVISPMDLMKTQGADILRLWVVSADYSEDIRIGKEILKGHADAYRRLRNTLRYLLGNLADFQESERVSVDEMTNSQEGLGLELWVLHRLSELDKQVREANDKFEYQKLYAAIHNFCAMDLSAFYFDIRKDVLYCDRPDSLRRRAVRTVLDHLFHCLTTWLAPVLVFTTEEAWLTRFPLESGSIHLQQFPSIDPGWGNFLRRDIWEAIRRLRRVVTGALELERKEKRIGASLEASPLVYVDTSARSETTILVDPCLDAPEFADLAAICITSGIKVVRDKVPANAFTLDDAPGIGVVPARASGEKCERCWQIFEKLEADGVCARCADAVATLEAA